MFKPNTEERLYRVEGFWLVLLYRKEKRNAKFDVDETHLFHMTFGYCKGDTS